MNQPNKERFKTSVGGQALMEGIMMRGPKNICCAVRKPDGTIETKVEPTPTHGVWTKIPLVRGAISMIESLIMGYKYMMYSAQVSMGDDYDPAEEETAFEKWVGDHLGKKAEDIDIHAKEILNIRHRLNSLLAHHTGQTLETIERDTERDNFMSAERAAEYGLIDSVFSKRQMPA